MLHYLRYETPFDMNYYTSNYYNEENNKEYINKLKEKYNDKKYIENIYNKLYNEN